MEEAREQIILRLQQMAGRMRKHAINMAFSAGSNGAHIGPGLSIIEIMATLYGAVMNIDSKNPQWENRDRFILSKGHGTLGYYTALAEAGFFPVEELKTFEVNEGFLPGQPTLHMPKGIEFSGGSLGLGLSFGVGVALVAKRDGKPFNTYVLLGDGECNEGTIWEAAMAAAHYELGNLVVVVDKNDLQSDGPNAAIMNLGDLAAKWRSFGWEVAEAKGHDVGDLYDAFARQSCKSNKPFALLAHTVKGKGVSFIENNNAWHHSRLSKEQHEAAMQELERL